MVNKSNSWIQAFDALPDWLRTDDVEVVHLCPRHSCINNKVRPNLEKVIRTQIFSRHNAIRCALDGQTVFGTWQPVAIAVLPLPDLLNVFDVDQLCELGDGHAIWRFEVFMEIHGYGRYSICYGLSIAFAAIASAIV